MQPSPPLPIRLTPLLPPVLRPWAQPLEPVLWRLLVPAGVMDGVDQARRSSAGPGFARRLLDALDIRYEVDDADRKRIPASGAAVIVANHPYGIVEGLIFAAMLECIRPDWKIVANAALAGVTELRSHLILVNPFDAPEAHFQNRAPLRESLRMLSAKGALVMFPAGEVAHLNWMQHSIADPPWKTTAARLAIRAQSPIVPVFFEGNNSVPFQVAGVIHPGFRTIGLAREFHKMRGKTVRVRIGQSISHGVIGGYRDAERATAYVRLRTFFLANRAQPVPPHANKPAPAADARVPEQALVEEIASLPAEAELASSSEFAVYSAAAREIPRLLPEIGRCREIAFRAIGEGTGNEIDLDRFDEHYRHLILWSKADRRLAGAYRMAVTTDILPRFGLDGLYTSTLFRFQPEFFERLGPAVELGRSFVLADYQKNYASLFLLWKGIMRCVLRRPEAPVLFGAVSISQDYREASRGLIAAYLSDRASHELARFVSPHRRFHTLFRRDEQARRLASLAADIEDLSLSVSDIEDDGKGVPVLIRQYLKMGGRSLGFNVDASFSNALDALLMTDLRNAPQALLERCMGREEARAFISRPQLSRA
jgi:putative hemolysin